MDHRCPLINTLYLREREREREGGTINERFRITQTNTRSRRMSTNVDYFCFFELSIERYDNVIITKINRLVDVLCVECM